MNPWCSGVPPDQTGRQRGDCDHCHQQDPGFRHPQPAGEEVGISVEPCRRDTFPAIALATAYLADVQGVDPEEPVVVCPVDPYVEDDYFEALKALSEQAAKAKPTWC